MRANKAKQQMEELTPLEKVEYLYAELVDWYGDADKKELRAAANEALGTTPIKA